MTAPRRLAATLAVDVVGYSRLMSQDEAGTAKAVGERRDAAQPMVAKRRRGAAGVSLHRRYRRNARRAIIHTTMRPPPKRAR